MIVKCSKCGKEIERRAESITGNHFCIKCRKQEIKKEKICEECGVKFMGRNTQKFCSRKCANINYYRNKSHYLNKQSKKYYQNHRQKILGQVKNWRQNNLEKDKKNKREYFKRIRKQTKNRDLIRLYGISYDEYCNLCFQQKNKCAICGKQITSKLNIPKSLVGYVDHNHQTNKIRGILCASCNLGLGAFRDNPKYLKLAIKYLKANS